MSDVRFKMSDVRYNGSATFPAAPLEIDEARGHGTKPITLGDFMTTYDKKRFVREQGVRPNHSVRAATCNGCPPPQPVQGLPALGQADQWPALAFDEPTASTSTRAQHMRSRNAPRAAQQHTAPALTSAHLYVCMPPSGCAPLGAEARGGA